MSETKEKFIAISMGRGADDVPFLVALTSEGRIFVQENVWDSHRAWTEAKLPPQLAIGEKTSNA